MKRMTEERYAMLCYKCSQMVKLLDDIIYELKAAQELSRRERELYIKPMPVRQYIDSKLFHEGSDGTIVCDLCESVSHFNPITKRWECPECDK